jgi:UPF0755 protein
VTKRPAPKKTKTLPLRRRAAAVGGGAVATLAGAAVVLAAAAVWLYAGPGPASREGGQTTVILRKGAGLGEIGSTLARQGAIRSSSLFIAAAQATGQAKRLKAGEYAFESGASLSSVIRDIREGRIVHHYVTIPEGVTSERVAEILAAADGLTGQAPTPAEGSVLPETYEVNRGDDRAAVLERMTKAQDALLDSLWSQRQEGLPFTTRQEAVTLASVVEKETGLAAERPRIGAVFVNRLKKGMRLESDPTIIYALTRGRPLGRGIRLSEITTPSPYNTYLVAGLPPTPIANPGRAAIAAVLDPPQSDELFFVADGSGGHVFASSFEQHKKNVENWRAFERRQAAGR